MKERSMILIVEDVLATVMMRIETTDIIKDIMDELMERFVKNVVKRTNRWGMMCKRWREGN